MLEHQEQQKKTKYLERCLEMRREFTDLVYLVDGMLGGGCEGVREAASVNPHREVAKGLFGDDGILPLANVPGSSELDTLMIKGQQENRGLAAGP